MILVAVVYYDVLSVKDILHYVSAIQRYDGICTYKC